MSARLDPSLLQAPRGASLPGESPWKARSPAAIEHLAGRLAARFALAASLLAAASLALGWPSGVFDGASAPSPVLHLAAAWAALGVYLTMAACAALALGPGGRIAAISMRALAPSGACFALLALWTGMLSDRMASNIAPSGAQLTAEAILLVMYAGFALLRAAARDAAHADRGRAALVLVGAFNLPIIYFSVQWWDTLHKAPALGAAMPGGAIAGILLMALALCAFAIAMALARVRSLMRQDAAKPRHSIQEKA